MLLDSSPPILFLDTVLNPKNSDTKKIIHIGASLVTKEHPVDEAFANAAQVAVDTNIFDEGRDYNEVVAYLEPKIYRSTWIGNKAIYRSRLLIADGGRLKIIAPGVDRFGEDPSIDSVLRTYGYRGEESIKKMKNDGALDANLAAAAHILHSSTFDRFTVEYVAPNLGREEVEGVGFTFSEYLDASEDSLHTNEDYEGDQLFNVDEEGRLHIFHPGVALWKGTAK